NRRQCGTLFSLRVAIDCDSNLSVFVNSHEPILSLLLQTEGPPKPTDREFTLVKILQTLLLDCARKNQTIFRARRGDVQHPHALKVFTPRVPLTQLIIENPAHRAAAPVGNADRHSFVTIENESELATIWFAMQI